MARITTKPNEPAFPDEVNFGLTIREHFASLAMQGIMANPANADNSFQSSATASVKMADELIAALNRDPAL